MVASKKYLISGASGLVGEALQQILDQKGHEVRKLVRRDPAKENEFFWDPESGNLDEASLEGVDGVIHLAGENIATGRWSEEKKQRLWNSREKSTLLLARSMDRMATPPGVFISASGTGFYGDRGDEMVTENSEPGSGYLSELCQAWERAATVGSGNDALRIVHLRIAPVLAVEGGLLPRILPIFRAGLGGRLGTGKQYMPWIHLDDLVAIIAWCLGKKEIQGAVNAVAPEAVRNLEFTKTLGRILGRPTLFPAPAFVLKTAFGEMAEEMLLSGARVSPKVLLDHGFPFGFPDLEKGLRDLLKRQ